MPKSGQVVPPEVLKAEAATCQQGDNNVKSFIQHWLGHKQCFHPLRYFTTEPLEVYDEEEVEVEVEVEEEEEKEWEGEEEEQEHEQDFEDEEDDFFAPGPPCYLNVDFTKDPVMFLS